MLALDVTFLGGAYEAADADGAEWPPHPARAFCALVSVARPGTADDDALRWLEALPPPTVQAPPARPSSRRAYVPTNAVDAKDSHQAYLARTSGSRAWARSFPSQRTTRFVWPEAEAAPDLVERLDGLARRVPYLGRSTSPALLAFTAEAPGDAGLPTYEPDPAGRARLRTARPGYLAHLRAAFESRSELPTVPATPYRA
ncbi:MAG: type I-G CRISPR-associated protein Csb2, partial [Acidimicrobiales bacterium]